MLRELLPQDDRLEKLVSIPDLFVGRIDFEVIFDNFEMHGRQLGVGVLVELVGRISRVRALHARGDAGVDLLAAAVRLGRLCAYDLVL